MKAEVVLHGSSLNNVVDTVNILNDTINSNNNDNNHINSISNNSSSEQIGSINHQQQQHFGGGNGSNSYHHQRAPRTPESYFNVPESIALLNIVKSERIQNAFQSNRKNHASVWEMVAEVLNRFSTRKRSAKQCCNRYENLKKIYTQLKKNPERHVRRNWPYMFLFKEIEEQRGECWGANGTKRLAMIAKKHKELSYYHRRRHEVIGGGNGSGSGNGNGANGIDGRSSGIDGTDLMLIAGESGCQDGGIGRSNNDFSLLLSKDVVQQAIQQQQQHFHQQRIHQRQHQQQQHQQQHHQQQEQQQQHSHQHQQQALIHSLSAATSNDSNSNQSSRLERFVPNHFVETQLTEVEPDEGGGSGDNNVTADGGGGSGSGIVEAINGYDLPLHLQAARNLQQRQQHHHQHHQHHAQQHPDHKIHNNNNITANGSAAAAAALGLQLIPLGLGGVTAAALNGFIGGCNVANDGDVAGNGRHVAGSGSATLLSSSLNNCSSNGRGLQPISAVPLMVDQQQQQQQQQQLRLSGNNNEAGKEDTNHLQLSSTTTQTTVTSSTPPTHAETTAIITGTVDSTMAVKAEPLSPEPEFNPDDITLMQTNYNGSQNFYPHHIDPHILQPDVIVDTDNLSTCSDALNIVGSSPPSSKRRRRHCRPLSIAAAVAAATDAAAGVRGAHSPSVSPTTSTTDGGESTNFELIEFLKRREIRDEEMLQRMDAREERLLTLLERTVTAIESLATATRTPTPSTTTAMPSVKESNQKIVCSQSTTTEEEDEKLVEELPQQEPSNRSNIVAEEATTMPTSRPSSGLLIPIDSPICVQAIKGKLEQETEPETMPCND